MISIKSRREIELMRATCRLAADTLDLVGKSIEVGMTTEDLNEIAHKYIIENDATPSPLNYNGFPKSICTSVNEVVCHGIPNPKEKIKDGDLVNVDVTTYLNGFHGDTNRTFFAGNVSDEHQKLVEVTYDCMLAGIKEVAPGKTLGDIGASIQELAESQGYSVVRDYCGHGIGREFHEDPQVLHYGTRNTGLKFKEGMTFTVEPMINLGSHHVELLEDDWTVITRDGKFSAQFEHTILVTPDGFEILTLSPQEREKGHDNL